MASLPDEEQIIKTRFLTDVSTSFGKQEPPFKRLPKHLLRFWQEVEGGTVEKAAEQLFTVLREVVTLEYTARKLSYVIATNKREQLNYVQKQREIEETIEQAKTDIAQRKQQLEDAKQTRQHLEEYENIKRDIMGYPSRADSQMNIAQAEADIQAIRNEEVRLDNLLGLRKKQFSLLLHCIEELKGTANEDLYSDIRSEPTAMELA